MHVVQDGATLEFGVRFNRNDQQDAKWFVSNEDRKAWLDQQAGAIQVVSFWNPKRLMK